MCLIATKYSWSDVSWLQVPFNLLDVTDIATIHPLVRLVQKQLTHLAGSLPEDLRCESLQGGLGLNNPNGEFTCENLDWSDNSGGLYLYAACEKGVGVELGRPLDLGSKCNLG
jgi:hypothetical protein